MSEGEGVKAIQTHSVREQYNEILKHKRIKTQQNYRTSDSMITKVSHQKKAPENKYNDYTNTYSHTLIHILYNTTKTKIQLI